MAQAQTIRFMVFKWTIWFIRTIRAGTVPPFSNEKLVAPHSNTGIERVYALVNKNKSEGSDRYRLDIEGTLSSILAVKLDQPEAFSKCYEFAPNVKLISEAKKEITKCNNLGSLSSSSKL